MSNATNKAVVWSLKNPQDAKVDRNGVVKAVGLTWENRGLDNKKKTTQHNHG